MPDRPSPSSPASPADTFAALRVPNFGRYILALFTLTLGIQIQGTVVGWQVYDLTHDPLALGLIGLAEALPAISMSLFAGHFADTHDRRRIALGVQRAVDAFSPHPRRGDLSVIASTTPA